jgi:hypothetical protein
MMIIGGGRQSYWQICSQVNMHTKIVACSILATIVLRTIVLLYYSTCIIMMNTTRKNEREHKPGTELQGILTCSLLHHLPKCLVRLAGLRICFRFVHMISFWSIWWWTTVLPIVIVIMIISYDWLDTLDIEEQRVNEDAISSIRGSWHPATTCFSPSAHTKELFWIRVLTRPMLDLDETTSPWPRSLLVFEGRAGSASEFILIHGNPVMTTVVILMIGKLALYNTRLEWQGDRSTYLLWIWSLCRCLCVTQLPTNTGVSNSWGGM